MLLQASQSKSMKKPQKQSKPAHLISELICQRFFATKGFKTLPPKFWNDERFARHYRLQMIKANALLKMYMFEAIMNALKSKEGCRCWSLTGKWLDPIIATEQKKLLNLQRKVEEHAKNQTETPLNTTELPSNPVFSPTFSPNKSILDTLDS